MHQTGAAVLQSQYKTEGTGGEEGRREAEKGELGQYPDSELLLPYVYPDSDLGQADNQ